MRPTKIHNPWPQPNNDTDFEKKTDLTDNWLFLFSLSKAMKMREWIGKHMNIQI